MGRPTLRVRFPRGGVANAGSLRHGPQRGRAVPLVPPSAPHGVAMFSRCLSGRLQPPHWQRLGLGLTRSMPVARPAPLKIRTRAQRLRSPLKLRTPADTGSGPSGWARRASPGPGDHASLSLSGPPATGTRRPSWEQPPGGASERQLDTRTERIANKRPTRHLSPLSRHRPGLDSEEPTQWCAHWGTQKAPTLVSQAHSNLKVFASSWPGVSYQRPWTSAQRKNVTSSDSTQAARASASGLVCS